MNDPKPFTAADIEAAERRGREQAEAAADLAGKAQQIADLTRERDEAAAAKVAAETQLAEAVAAKTTAETERDQAQAEASAATQRAKTAETEKTEALAYLDLAANADTLAKERAEAVAALNLFPADAIAAKAGGLDPATGKLTGWAAASPEAWAEILAGFQEAAASRGPGVGSVTPPSGLGLGGAAPTLGAPGVPPFAPAPEAAAAAATPPAGGVSPGAFLAEMRRTGGLTTASPR